jgi:hypothetical protein
LTSIEAVCTTGACFKAGAGRSSRNGFDDRAVAHRDTARRSGRKRRVVRRDDDRRSVTFAETGEQLDDVRARLRVEVPRRLVGEDDIRG